MVLYSEPFWEFMHCFSVQGPLSRDACMRPSGVGRFENVVWHKKEHDDLLTELGISPKYGDVPDYGDKKRGWLSDYEHRDIVGLRMTGLSMHKIAEHPTVHRSSKTVSDHLHDHNEQVRKREYCVRCRRIKGNLDAVEV